MDKNTLYKLDVECTNPKPDRRKKGDWQFTPKFPKGLYVLVERDERRCWEGDDDDVTFVSREFKRVSRDGGTCYGRINENGNKEEFAALAAAVEEIKPDRRNIVHYLASGTSYISEPNGMMDVVGWMLRNGVISPEQVDIALERLQKEWNKEEDNATT